MVTARKIRFSAITVFQWRRHQRRMGRYIACVIRAAGFFDSGCNLPRRHKGISAGTSVIESSEEKISASVFVQASGRNMRPSVPPKKNPAKKQTRKKNREKKGPGPPGRPPARGKPPPPPLGGNS